MILNRSFCRAALAGIALLSVLVSACKSRPESTDIVILFTTDVYNNVLPYDFDADQSEGSVSLANFASLVDEQRKIYGDRCLVFDNGNVLPGDVVSFYYSHIDSISEPVTFRAQRLVGYDGLSVGARDFSSVLRTSEPHWSEANRPLLLCANLVEIESGKPRYQPYIILEREGIRIAVMAMMSPAIFDWYPKEKWRDLEVEDMIECAQKWMPEIQSHNPDIVIGLMNSSMNYREMGYNLESYKNPNGGIPAALKTAGFDLLLLGNGGKNRVELMQNDEGGSFTCIQNTAKCEYAGLVRIRLKRRADSDTYDKRTFATHVNLHRYFPDEDYSEALRPALDSIRHWYNTPIGFQRNTIYGSEGYFGADPYRTILHQAQMRFTGADISLASCAIADDTLLMGPITAGSIFRAYPFQNQLGMIRMSGEELIRLLEHAADIQFDQMLSPSDPLLRLHYDARGHLMRNDDGVPRLEYHPTLFTSAYGIRYTVDVSKPVGQRIRVSSMADGSPFDPRRSYTVALNSYIFRDSGARYISRGLRWNQETLMLHVVPIRQYSMHYVIYTYLRSLSGDLHSCDDRNWHVIPEAWWHEAMQRQQSQPLPTFRR